MLISHDGSNKFSIRNSSDLSVINTIEHEFGSLLCGLYYQEQNVVVMGIENNLAEFDFQKMKITNNFKTKDYVYCIEKVNDETFLIGGYN